MMKSTLLIRFIALLFLVPLAACSSFPIAMPFKTLDTGEPQPMYVVIVTLAEYRAKRGVSRAFFNQVADVQASLEASDAYGYSIRRDLIARRAWTYSIWPSDDAKDRFKFSGAHLDAMNQAPDLLARASFARTIISADQLPYSWDEALALLDREGRSYDF